MTIPINEMQAEAYKARLEADVEKASKDAQARIAEARAEEAKIRAKAANRDAALNVTGFILALLIVFGGFIAQHIYHTYEYNKQVSACQEAGGTWSTKYQDVKSSRSGELHTDKSEYCDRNNPYMP